MKIRSLLLAAFIAVLPQSAHAQLMQLDSESTAVSDVPTPMISWVDDKAPRKGYMLCVHGLGLHKGTYQQFGERMAKLGWAVYACDVRGFGSFMELGRATTVDFDRSMDDVCNALKTVRGFAKGKPVFIVGESMGGAMALQVASSHPELVEGLVSSVPAGERNHSFGDKIKVGVHLLTGAHKNMDVRKIVVDRSTDDEKLKQDWLHDDLARFDLSPVELIKFQNFMGQNHSAAKKIDKIPVLMIRGLSDALVTQKGNETLFNEMPTQKKILVEVENKEHLLLEEGQFDDSLIAEIVDFLNAATQK